MPQRSSSVLTSTRATVIPEGSVQNLSHFGLAERHPALAHAVMAPLICWSFSNSMFRHLFVDHAVPAFAHAEATMSVPNRNSEPRLQCSQDDRSNCTASL